jgi:hypothetical protein
MMRVIVWCTIGFNPGCERWCEYWPITRISKTWVIARRHAEIVQALRPVPGMLAFVGKVLGHIVLHRAGAHRLGEATEEEGAADFRVAVETQYPVLVFGKNRLAHGVSFSMAMATVRYPTSSSREK